MIAVRMIVLSEKDSYSIEIRHLAHTDGTDSFAITPSGLLIRLFVAPLTVTFDSTTRNVLRYEGRVPPMLQVEGKLRTLDARVDYTMNAASYR